MKIFFIFLFLIAYAGYSQQNEFSDMDFSRIDSIAIHYKFKGNIDPVRVATDLTRELESDIDKYRVIFRWIAENIDYDVKLYRKDSSYRQNRRRFPGKYKRWTRRFDKIYTKHTLKERMTICGGYSWLLAVPAAASC